MPRKKTDEQTEETGPRRGDYVLVEDSVVRVGGDGAPDLEPRYRVMVVGRVKLNAVVEVVSPEQHVPGNAKAETGRTAEFSTAYPLPGDALERLGSMAVSEVQAQSWASLDDAWAWISGGEPPERDLEGLAAAWGNGERPVAEEPRSVNGPADEPAHEPADAPVDEPDEPGDAERPADGRDIACPECGAEVGKSCRYPSGYYYSRGHTSRRPDGVVSAMVDDARLDMECPECLAEAGKPCRVVLVRGHAARR